MANQWGPIETDVVERAWKSQWGGEYPPAMIEAYLAFVESMAGTATVAMEVMVDINRELEQGGEVSPKTRQKIHLLLARDYAQLRTEIKQAFLSLFEEAKHE